MSNSLCQLIIPLIPADIRKEIVLLFTPFSATRFAMHRIYANRINSRGMSRVFCDLRSQKTPRGILPVNSNEIVSYLRNSYPFPCKKQKTIFLFSNPDTKKHLIPRCLMQQGYKDSNLELTESESVALPFGDSPLCFVFATSFATIGII